MTSSPAHRPASGRIRQIMEANAATGLGDGHYGESSQSTYVYVRDDSYAWLPARLLSIGGGRSGSSSGEDSSSGDSSAGATATVLVALPPDWRDQTCLHPDTGDIEDLERMTVYAGSAHGSISRRGSTASEGSGSDLGGLVGVRRTVQLGDYPCGELPLQNVDRRGRLVQKADMASLPFLHEAAILYNLKERHARGIPYTRVGDIVVAMNPFRWIDGLYSDEKRNFYSQRLIWSASPSRDGKAKGGGEEGGDEDHGKATSIEPKAVFSEYDRLGYDPHVYETSCLAYRGLACDRKDQTILVSGESGAGKTETVKIVMSHLVTAEWTRPTESSVPTAKDLIKGREMTVHRLLESNPIFEAFGNAKTVRNDNSSRFGKFTRLRFDVEGARHARVAGRTVPRCLLAGSACTTYLLEKSRVVGHSPGERTYHIFHQLLAAPENEKVAIWEGLGATQPTSFVCVGDGCNDLIDGQSDADGWQQTIKALLVFGIHGDELRDLMRAICVIMQLGNLTFEFNPDNDNQDQTYIASRDDLHRLGDVMGVAIETIEHALTERVIKVSGEEIKTGLSPADARGNRDALSKELYARTFDFLVRIINEKTSDLNHDSPADDTGNQKLNQRKKFSEISLLDIFGFERFGVNQFEQLCINYANERLQHQYVLDNFNEVKDEYKTEGVEIFDFSKVDNSTVLLLLEGKMGIITSLNEECKRPKGNDAAFVYKIKTMLADCDKLIQGPLDFPTQFGIDHFAGHVDYDASNFVERNTDKLPDDLVQCACESTNMTIKMEFQRLSSSVQRAISENRRGGLTTKHTVITTFRMQLTDLMRQIRKTKTRYIRCIKPNPQMKAGITNHCTTTSQLECAGLVTAIAISRESFPNRLAYQVIADRFRCLIPRRKMMRRPSLLSSVVRHEVESLLMNLLCVTTRQDMPFALGKTKVYFRAGALERLESIRIEYFSTRAIVLQSWTRTIQAFTRYRSMRIAAISIQARWRGHFKYSRYHNIKNAALVLQCGTRCFFAVRRLKRRRENYAATVVQRHRRMSSYRSYYLKVRNASVVIQRCYRNKKTQSDMLHALRECVAKVTMDNRLSKLRAQVHRDSSSSNVMAQSTAEVKRMDESTMHEMESMLAYTRNEIDELRQENLDLQSDMKKLEDSKKDLSRQIGSIDAAAKVANRALAQAEQNSKALALETKDHRREAAAMRRELKKKDEIHARESDCIRRDFEKSIMARDAEIKKFKSDLKSAKRALRMEREMLIDEVERVKEQHLFEIARLEHELKNTRANHEGYLAKLMDVLETTHEQREGEAARIKDELASVRDQKEIQIGALKNEIKNLKSELLKQSYQLGSSPLTSPRSSPMAQETREMAQRLGLPSHEESQSSIDSETQKMAQQLGLPPRADESYAQRRMAEALERSRQENDKLREELTRARGSCRACGYRNDGGAYKREERSIRSKMRSKNRYSDRGSSERRNRVAASNAAATSAAR